MIESKQVHPIEFKFSMDIIGHVGRTLLIFMGDVEFTYFFQSTKKNSNTLWSMKSNY